LTRQTGTLNKRRRPERKSLKVKKNLVRVTCLQCLSNGAEDPYFETDDPINNRICPRCRASTQYGEDDWGANDVRSG